MVSLPKVLLDVLSRIILGSLCHRFLSVKGKSVCGEGRGGGRPVRRDVVRELVRKRK